MKKTPLTALLGAACLLALPVAGWAQASYNSVRVALSGTSVPPDGLLQRARTNGYTHVLADLPVPTQANLPALRSLARDAFVKANAYGLKFIPQIQTGSKWSIHWRNINSSIRMNVLQAPDGEFGLPSLASFSYNGVNYDMEMFNSFRTVINTVYQGFLDAKAAGLSYANLEYFSIGHDEPVHGDRLLVGNGSSSSSSFDRAFIQNNRANFGNSYDSTYMALLVREVYHRVNQIQAAIPTQPRVIISADMWDPQANGGNRKTTHLTSGGVPISVRMVSSHTVGKGIANLPGLTSTEKTLLYNKLVLAPWNYYKAWPWSGDPDGNGLYEPSKTFAYMAGSGFNILYWGTIAIGNETIDAGVNLISSDAMRRNVSAAFNHRSKVLGYIAGYWGSTTTPGQPGYCIDYSQPGNTCFMTLEYMRDLNRPHQTRRVSRAY